MKEINKVHKRVDLEPEFTGIYLNKLLNYRVFFLNRKQGILEKDFDFGVTPEVSKDVGVILERKAGLCYSWVACDNEHVWEKIS